MKRLPLNNFLIVLLSQLIVIGITLLIPQSMITDFNIWLVLCLTSISTFIVFFLGLRGAFLLVTPAITIGGIFIIYFPGIIPSWFLLAGFLILASLHLPAVWTHVPYYPTPQDIDQHLLKLIPHQVTNGKKFIFADLGCGTGRLLYNLAKTRSDVEFYGAELSLLPYCIAKIRSFLLPNLTIQLKSFWKIDIGHFNIIYTFLSPAPMEQIGHKISTELQAGSFLVSNSFQIPLNAIPGFEEKKYMISESMKGGTLYIYRHQS